MTNRVFFRFSDVPEATEPSARIPDETPVRKKAAPRPPSSRSVFRLGNRWRQATCQSTPAIHRLGKGAGFVSVPEFYEPRYAYPLIIWWGRLTETVFEFRTGMAAISPRNCVGLHIAASAWHRCSTENQRLALLRSLVRQTGRQWNIHSQRLVLLGTETAAEEALRLFLAQPAWFAGAALLFERYRPFALPAGRVPFCHPGLRGKRILLSYAEASQRAAPSSLRQRGQLLYAAGLKVRLRGQRPASPGPVFPGLAAVNTWLMEELCTAGQS